VCDLETTKILVNEEEAKATRGAIAPRGEKWFLEETFMYLRRHRDFSLYKIK